MRSVSRANAGRQWLRCVPTLVLVGLLGCAETSLAPDSPGVPNAPSGPTRAPSSPATGLTLSRPDVVFNVVAGAAQPDSAAISVSARSDDLARLRVQLRYTGLRDAEWLDVQVDRSSTPVVLRFQTREVSLPAGAYSATALLEVPGIAMDSVTITMRVLSGPGIGLSAARICFTPVYNDGSLPKDDVRITSVDGSPLTGLTATVEYDAGQPGGWLTTAFVATSAPTRLWLHGTPGTLPVGTYHATVRVAAPGADNSPVPIRVTLTVNEPVQPPPGGSSVLNVRIAWEGPTHGGVGKVLGNRTGSLSNEFYCLLGATEGCTGTLENGIGEFFIGPLTHSGAQFLRWEGACAGQVFGCTVRFDTPGTTREAVAVFHVAPGEIRIVTRGTGSGTFLISPAGAPAGSGVPLSCASSFRTVVCGRSLAEGVATFTLWAVPAAGSVFAGWDLTGRDNAGSIFSSCHGTSPSCTISFASGGNSLGGAATWGSGTVGGRLLAVDPVALGVVVPGVAVGESSVQGRMPPVTGTITGPGIDCRFDSNVVTGDCHEQMTPGAVLRLVRTPGPGVSCTATPGTETPGDCEIVVTGQEDDIRVAGEFFTQLNSVRIHMRGTGNGVASGPPCFLVDGVQSEEGPIPPGELARCTSTGYGIGEHVFRAEPYPGTVFVNWTGDCQPVAGRPADYCGVNFTGSGREANITATFALSP